MEDKSKHIDYLITRYLAEEATPQETDELWQWMDSSESNKKYFTDIKFVHDKAVASHRIVKVNIEKAWSNVNRQMVQKQDAFKPEELKSIVAPSASKKNELFGLLAPRMRVAAMLVLIVGASYLVYNILHPNDTVTIVADLQSTKDYKLTDSTHIVLNKNSSLTYDHQFNKKLRKVHLSGEAYFQVKHLPEKKFIVETSGVLIEDIGTSFNIKAYAGDSIVEVYVESGIVKFFSLNEEGIMISRGETGIYRKDTHLFRKKIKKDPNVLSFQTNVFLFENALLSDVLKKIGSHYNQKITVHNPDLLNCRITVTFEHEDLNYMVVIIAETLGLKLVSTNDGYILEGNSCNAQ